MSLDFLSLLAADSEAFARAIESGPAAAEIAGCPGWTLPALGAHLGTVQRWARHAILTGEPPRLDPASDPAPGDLAGLAGWLREGAGRLLDTLRTIDPQQPTWHPFPVEPKVLGIWPRRQAQEASVHRWDAEHAIGGTPTIAMEFAADGIDEYWTVMLPRLITRESLSVPCSVIAVNASDAGGRWVIDGRSGAVVMASPEAVPAAELTGPAESVLLRLWGRPVADGQVELSGDLDVIGHWLSLGGA
ncbi:MAG: maleylpyruvate isomerase family mycothiol-dependent enzyme [Ilumatobacteraceae bacterium]